MSCLPVEYLNVVSSICALVIIIVVGDCVECDVGWCGVEVGCD